MTYGEKPGRDGERENAYLTVFLALCMTVILSLFLVLLDGVRRNGCRLEIECVTDIGLQSILAEYHRELMLQYNLFAIDASYGTELCSKENTEAHLRRYLEKNISYEDVFLSGFMYRDFLSLSLEQVELTGVSIFTDEKGAVFRRCAVEAVKADVGLGLLEELQGWMQTIEVNGLEDGKEEREKQKYDEQLEEYKRVRKEMAEKENLKIRNSEKKAAENGETERGGAEREDAGNGVAEGAGTEKGAVESKKAGSGGVESEKAGSRDAESGDAGSGGMESKNAGGKSAGGESEESGSAKDGGTDRGIVETEWEMIENINPTMGLEEKKRLGILKLVIENEEALSHNAINVDGLISKRMEQGKVNVGNGDLEEQSGLEQLAERFVFQEYLLRYMGHYGAEREEDALRYQIEYLIAGAGNDSDNLRSVANRICLVREAANALYLMSSDAKRQEIKLAAEVICALIAQPELVPVLEGVILLGWAYAESVYDVKSLLSGGRVPLVKDDDSWHYGLTAALEGSLNEETREGEGLSYEDYLRIFMMFTDIDTVTERAMNMVEADIRNTPGNEAFRLDGCYATVEAWIEVSSSYGYRYEITRKAGYVRW